MMNDHKVGNACFRSKQNIGIFFDKLSFEQCLKVVILLEKSKLIVNNQGDQVVHEFYVEMFLEMVSTEINQLYAYLCNTNILRLIKHINFFNLSILNLNNCSIDSIESLCFINTGNLKYLYLYDNPVYRLKSLAKCFSTNGIKQLGIQRNPISLMNQDQLLKKLKFSNIDIFRIFIYQLPMESYYTINDHIAAVMYKTSSRVKYYYRIPWNSYQVNFTNQYKQFQEMFYFKVKK